MNTVEPSPVLPASHYNSMMSAFASYVVARWKKVLVVSFLCGAIGLTYAWLSDKTYVAELSYALEERGSSLGAYASIASQFGLDLGKSDGGAFSGDNILELIRSRFIIERTLLTEVTIEGKKDLLVNRMLDFQKRKSGEGEEPGEKHVEFTVGVPREKFTVKQDSVLQLISRGIGKYNLSGKRLDKKLVIYSIQFESDDELFAKSFLEILVRNVTEFYVQTKTKKLRTNIDLLEARIDSVKTQLESEMLGVALHQDENQNVIRARVRIPQVRKQLNVQLLTTMYGELVKHLELSKLSLLKEEPLIQIIDRPILPLRFKKPSRMISAIIGGVLGCIVSVGSLGVAFLYTRKGFRQPIVQ
jgi:uncharacterized protein involved in exopolysaccharide biosynthesis